ncbi:MAG: hypothetical protein ABIR03_04330 [Ginsengibacter sp.]
MQRYILKHSLIIIGIIAISIISCKKEYTDPSRATQENVFNSIPGLTGAVVGLQRVFSLSQAGPLYNIVTINGLLTRELFVINQGNINEYKLSLGNKEVDGNNTLITGLWITSNKIIYDADNVIKSSASLSDKGIASGLIGYATIFKSLAIGAMSEFWENIPDSIGPNMTFIPRA